MINPGHLALAAAEGSALEAQLTERLSGYDQMLLRLARALAVECASDYLNGSLYWNKLAWAFVSGLVARHTSEREPRARKSLAAVGLSEFANHYPGQLSGGMRQRAALARALSLETGIILMDEPFGALDEQTRMVLGEDLSVLLSRTGKTIVFVTHSLGEAVFLADRVAVFSARPGTIKEVITIDEPHPRKPGFMTSEKFTNLRNTLFALLHEEIRKAMEQSTASERAVGGGKS